MSSLGLKAQKGSPKLKKAHWGSIGLTKNCWSSQGLIFSVHKWALQHVLGLKGLTGAKQWHNRAHWGSLKIAWAHFCIRQNEVRKNFGAHRGSIGLLIELHAPRIRIWDSSPVKNYLTNTNGCSSWFSPDFLIFSAGFPVVLR